jgi:4-alpha-glucanotransferase
MALKGIKLIGDLPIYVSLDSSDAWANSKQFLFDDEYNPKLVAGVPPDYFSKTGQLWGNPLYDYSKMEKDNYKWWVERIKHISKYCQIIRIDHFRGFESFYAIKNGAENAIKGKWLKGPGIDLFNKIKEECPNASIIAEDLGIITRKVKNLISECGFPGMKILQFAFNKKKSNPYLPKNHSKNCVAYLGTHDNQTLKGFTNQLKEEEKVYIRSCFRFKEESIEDLLIKGLFKSKANLIVINAVDMLKLDDTYRMNEPSTSNDKNWAFRLTSLEDLFKLKNKYKRLNRKTKRNI